MQKLKILHLEDEKNITEMVSRILDAKNCKAQIKRVETEQEFLYELNKNNYDMVLADFSLPNYDGFLALEAFKKLKKEIPFILFSGSVGEEKAIDSLKMGATDYVLKQNVRTLYPAIKRAISQFEERNKRIRYQKQLEENHDILEKISSSVLDAIIMMDDQAQITFWNKGAELIFGYKKDEALDRNLHELIAPKEFVNKFNVNFPKFVESGKGDAIGKTLELIACKKDGTQFEVELSLSAVKIQNRWNAVGIIRDISERKKAENIVTQMGKILDTSHNEFYIFDKDSFQFMHVNAGGIKNNGYTLEELYEKKPWDLLTGYCEETFRKHTEDLKSGKENKIVFESFLERKDSTIYPVEVYLQQAFYKNKPAFVANILDITERLKNQEALRISEVKYRSLMDNLEIGISLISKDMEILTINKKMQSWFPEVNVESNPICYETFNIPPKKDLCNYCPTIKTLKDGKIHEATSKTRRDGVIKHYRIVSSPIFDDNGQIVSAIEMVEDITTRIKAEEKLKENEENYRDLVEKAGLAIFVDDKDGNWVYFNDYSCEMFGYSHSEMAKQSHKTLVHPDDLEMVTQFHNLRLDNKDAPTSYQCRCLRKDGSIIMTEVDVTVIYKNNKKVGTRNYLRDITERKNLESQLANAQKLESIGQLAAGIAHEINTPIQFVNDNTYFFKESFEDINQLLKKYRQLMNQCCDTLNNNNQAANIQQFEEDIDVEYLMQDIPNAIEQSLEGIKRVTKIVKAMREFSHPGQDEKVKLNINEALENTLIISKNEWKYVAEVETNFDENLPMVYGLPGELNQVFLNIIVNAAQAIGEKLGENGSEKGNIKISTFYNKKYAIVEIADSGNGIPLHIISKIFEPFFTTKPIGKGTGQGLAISHNVIKKKHNGKLEVESEVGKGSTFRIKLPLKGQKVKESQ